MVESLLPIRTFPLLPCPSGGNPAALPGGVADVWRIVRTAERLGAMIQAATPNVGGALWHPFMPAAIDRLPFELTLHPRCLEHDNFTLQPGKIAASGLVPTIMGISHTVERNTLHCRILADAYARGVRQIGIEATMRDLDRIYRREMDALIHLAQVLGMGIVPLESQPTTDYRTVMDMARQCLTPQDVFNPQYAQEMYENFTSMEKNVLEILATAPSSHPKRNEFQLLARGASIQAAYWHMVLTYLRGINYDIYRFTRDYYEAQHTRVRDEYATILSRQELPLVFMGAYHAEDLVGHTSTEGYRIIDISKLDLRNPS